MELIDVLSYILNDIETTNEVYEHSKKKPLRIERVIFNAPATIVFWNDGEKTMVKAQDGEVFDKEKGLALCVMKRVYGNKSNFNEVLKKWVKE